MYVREYEAANHRLIGAISMLAEHNHIAVPDGQLEVDATHAHAYKIHTHSHTRTHTCIRQTLSQTHGVH